MVSMFTAVAEKLKSAHGGSLAEIPQKTARLLVETASARIQLRDCNRVGSFPRLTGRACVRNEGHIEIGAKASLIGRWAPIVLTTAKSGSIIIGDQVGINYGTTIAAARLVDIGNRVLIGNYCVVSDVSIPFAEGMDEKDALPIEIGDDVWLAVRVTVLPGARIGRGTVVVAGSVVEGELPPGVVAGGIPARVLRSRNRAS